MHGIVDVVQLVVRREFDMCVSVLQQFVEHGGLLPVQGGAADEQFVAGGGECTNDEIKIFIAVSSTDEQHMIAVPGIGRRPEGMIIFGNTVVDHMDLFRRNVGQEPEEIVFCVSADADNGSAVADRVIIQSDSEPLTPCRGSLFIDEIVNGCDVDSMRMPAGPEIG